MNNRVCTGCGWVYPPSYNEARCRFCGTEFTERYCPDCGKLGVPYKKGSLLCRPCYVQRYWADGKASDATLLWRALKLQEIEETYQAWLKRITTMPFVPLTEEDWLRACRYFEGCALCDIPEIEARGYFIQFSDGGRYTAWNILPMCEKCATVLKMQINPFKRLNSQVNSNLPIHRGATYKKLDKAYEYLQERLDEYEKQSNASI